MAITGVFPGFVAENEAILPVPLEGRPIEVLSLVQLYVVAVPSESLLLFHVPPLHNT